MNIIKTNIADDEWTMDLSYDMFESPDRLRGLDLKGEQVHIDKYCLYEEDNMNGDTVRVLTVSKFGSISLRQANRCVPMSATRSVIPI